MRLTTTIVVLMALALVACGGDGLSLTPTVTSTPSPTPVQPAVTPALSPDEAIQTLCLVEHFYPRIEEQGGNVRRILAGLGLKVVVEGTPCDATLTFALTGEPLGASYGGALRDDCYTGAEFKGDVTLTMSGRAPLTMPISERKSTPYSTYSCPDKRGAPFDEILPTAMLAGLASMWPPAQVFGQALRFGDYELRRYAALALRDIGPEAKEAVPALIQALGDEESLVPSQTAQALRAITGQPFGEDAALWQQWWEEQQ